MKSFDITNLSNGIKVITRKNPNTPRIAINIFIDSGIKYEKLPGTATLAGRLLLQGTEKRSATQIAEEIDKNSIELGIETKQDYTKVKAVFLNETLDVTLDILSDILKNSTFKDFEKETYKFKGEIDVELDSPRAKAADNLVKHMYPDHPYGHTYTKVLDSLDKITVDAVKDFYSSTFNPEKMNIVVVGDINKEEIVPLLEKHFGDIRKNTSTELTLKSVEIKENNIVTIAKNDAAQAQIIQGWIVPNILNQDYPALTVLNTILGSSGLSSRLFVELRDKKGLAYVVRSSYDPLKHSGSFSVYIATAPGNIKVSLDGFNEEIRKLQTEPVSEVESENAKNNILGKRAFFHETNAQQAYYLGHYDILGLGADFDDNFAEKIKQVKAEDIKHVANKYLSANSIISILAPEEYLSAL